jgi:hypothetical protein
MVKKKFPVISHSYKLPFPDVDTDSSVILAVFVIWNFIVDKEQPEDDEVNWWNRDEIDAEGERHVAGQPHPTGTVRRDQIALLMWNDYIVRRNNRRPF